MTGLLGRIFGPRKAPLQLTAVPRDHVAGIAEVGEAIMRGTLVHRGEQLTLQGLDMGALNADAPLVRHLSSFAWLRDLEEAVSREQGARLGEAVMTRWLDSPLAEGDEPDRWGERLLFLTAYAPYVLSTRDPDYRRRLLTRMAQACKAIPENADKLAPGLPRITAWSGLTVAALVLAGSGIRIARAEAGLIRALGQGCHDDGGLKSRRPWEQAQLVDRLGLVRAAYFAAKQSLPEALEDSACAALAALHGVMQGDGGLASWQGGNPGSPERLAALIEGCGVRARPLRDPGGWGYHRLSALGTVVQMDAAPPPRAPYTIGGCASTLALEIADGGQRLVMSCGGRGDAPANLPGELGHALRASAAHSTLILADRNSTALEPAGGLGKGVTEIAIDRAENEKAGSIEASHDGYARGFGYEHHRAVSLANDGKQVTGRDRLEPVGRRLRRKPTPFTIRFHLAPQIEVSPTADGQGAFLRLPGNAPAWQFRAEGAALSIGDSLVLDASARPRDTQQLVLSGETGKEAAQVTWHFRRSS